MGETGENIEFKIQTIEKTCMTNSITFPKLLKNSVIWCVLKFQSLSRCYRWLLFRLRVWGTRFHTFQANSLEFQKFGQFCVRSIWELLCQPERNLIVIKIICVQLVIFSRLKDVLNFMWNFAEYSLKLKSLDYPLKNHWVILLYTFSLWVVEEDFAMWKEIDFLSVEAFGLSLCVISRAKE